MAKFDNKYRISSARAWWWDYSNESAYFITICTHHHQSYFGEIVHDHMLLSKEGIFAQNFWYEIPKQFVTVVLKDFIVMPNHVHGIIIINKPFNTDSGLITYEKLNGNNNHNSAKRLEAINRACSCSKRLEAMNRVSTRSCNSNLDAMNRVSTGGFSRDKNPMLKENVSKIIRWYKGRCSFEIRSFNPNFSWQSRFYDHIIRNEKEYQSISDYINNNPMTWLKDELYQL